MDWEANVVWQWGEKAPGVKANQAWDQARLANGNTLICEGIHGRIFRVTSDGEIVLENLNPHFGDYGPHNSGTGRGPANWTYHAQPVPYDWVPDNTSRSEMTGNVTWSRQDAPTL